MSDNAIQYRIVTELPLEAVVTLYKAASWWTEAPRNRAAIPGVIRGSFCFMVAEDNGKVVGMGRVISDGASDAYIQDLVVLPDYRGRHIGKELVRRLRDYCLEHDLLWIGLVAEPGTAEFYEDLGFELLAGHQAMLLRPRR